MTAGLGYGACGALASVLRKVLPGAYQARHACAELAEKKYTEMDFLKSAVASAISKGPAFGYTFGDRVDLNDSIWTLHNGTKRVWPGCLHSRGLDTLTLIC